MTHTFDVDHVVLDIEGTTSATGFVVGELYPYARKRFGRLLTERAAEPEVRRAVGQIRAMLDEPAADAARIERALGAWLDEDRKATPLKTLQGIVWAEGFASGELVSHFYPDVLPRLREWHAAGVRLHVYSSGSVAAQRAWFGHSPKGDLRPLAGEFYDTENAGPKLVAASYEAITADLGAAPGRMLFLSDRPGELDAARSAGWRTAGVRRPGEPYYESGVGDHPEVASFAELEIRTGDGARASAGTVAAAPDGPVVGVDEVRRAGARLAAEAARFAGLGWMRGTSGNLSVVLARDPLRLAVTASGRDKGELTADDVVLVDGRGAAAAGTAGVVAGSGKPSAEAGLHARVVRLTGAGAVVHVHTVAAVAMGRRRPGGIVFRDLEMLKGLGLPAEGTAVRLPVIANSQDMDVLGERLEAAREPRMPAVVVAGHGLYVWGADLLQARHHAEVVQWLLELEVASGRG
ncbi:acireductone synthase [Streptomyces monomycini]|uniref:acireductone synthase n=1 Tax=Streptomyces monomycini TaxID=371720 RepID=UPI0009961AE2|nr:acireductone synthase [Streptomyces monomycini]